MPTRMQLALGLSAIGAALATIGAFYLSPAAGFLTAGGLMLAFGCLLGVEFD